MPRRWVGDLRTSILVNAARQAAQRHRLRECWPGKYLDSATRLRSLDSRDAAAYPLLDTLPMLCQIGRSNLRILASRLSFPHSYIEIQNVAQRAIHAPYLFAVF